MHRLAATLLALCLPALASSAEKAPPKAQTQVTWYGQSTFVVQSPKGLVLAIDPWFQNPLAKDKEAGAKLPKVDYILLTHGHSDHVGEAIALGKRTGAKLVTVFELSSLLVAAGYPKDQATMATAGNAGGTIRLSDEVSVTLVPAVHTSSFSSGSGPAVAAGIPLGFVIQIAGGPTLYHTGDTDLTESMRFLGERFKIDVMMACIGGHFTMDPVGAAMAAGLVKPRFVVPMHFGTFPLLAGRPEELRAALKERKNPAEVVVLEVGQPRGF